MKRQGLRKICGKRKRQKYLMEIFLKDTTVSGGDRKKRRDRGRKHAKACSRARRKWKDEIHD